MPTPRSLGFDMKYQRAASCDSDTQRPLVVVAGWMGAKERQLKPYLKFYHDRGIDTLSFAVGPHHVLIPSKSMQQMEAVLDLVSANPPGCDGSGHKSPEDFQTPSSLLFHNFSVGGFLYGQTLLALSKRSDHGKYIQSNIRAQIFDSPPDFMNIPKGIARSMGIGGTGEFLVQSMAQLYVAATHNTAGVAHRASSAAFHENSISAPSLWFYSKADPVADWRDCVTVIEKWRGKGTQVEEVVWEDTPHIQHARVDPDRYFGALDAFLQRLGLADLEKGGARAEVQPQQ